MSLLEVGYGLVVGKFGQARDVIAAWFWNLSRTGQLMGRRQQLRRVRHVSDGEVRDLQSSGFARLTSLARVPGADDDEDVTPLARTAQRTVEFLRSGPSRETVFVWIILLILLVGGSRHLITRTIPAVGEFATMSGPATLLEQWTSVAQRRAGGRSGCPHRVRGVRRARRLVPPPDGPAAHGAHPRHGPARVPRCLAPHRSHRLPSSAARQPAHVRLRAGGLQRARRGEWRGWSTPPPHGC